MKRKSLLLTLGFIAVIALVAATSRPFPPSPARTSNLHVSRTSSLAYHDLWRTLWEDHITWTRMVIVGILDGLPGTNTYLARLLQNYEDMEDALQPYYGDGAEELGDLIKDHLVIAAELLNAAKAGNTTAFENARIRWYQNGKEIADSMAELNPKYWPVSESESMWKEHLDATLNEAVKHLTNDFAGDVAAYDEVHRLAIEMADFFSGGVMRQFPQRFSRF